MPFDRLSLSVAVVEVLRALGADPAGAARGRRRAVARSADRPHPGLRGTSSGRHGDADRGGAQHGGWSAPDAAGRADVEDAGRLARPSSVRAMPAGRFDTIRAGPDRPERAVADPAPRAGLGAELAPGRCGSRSSRPATRCTRSSSPGRSAAPARTRTWTRCCRTAPSSSSPGRASPGCPAGYARRSSWRRYPGPRPWICSGGWTRRAWTCATRWPTRRAAGSSTIDGDRIRFAHPILAAAAYGSIPVDRRRELHRAVAMLADDLEERARHLATAADGPDPEVARRPATEPPSRRGGGARPTPPRTCCGLACRLTPPADAEALALRRIAFGRLLHSAGDAPGAHRRAGVAGRRASRPV